MHAKIETQEILVRPYLNDARELDDVGQFVTGEGLAMQGFGNFAILITPKEAPPLQGVRYLPFIDIDDTTHKSTQGLIELTQQLLPSIHSQKVYDSIRIALDTRGRRGTFDPYFAIELLRHGQHDQTDAQALRLAKKEARRARAVGSLSIRFDGAGPTPEWIPQPYPYAEELLTVIGDVARMPPVALTRGAYLPQAEKVTGFIRSGRLSGALICKATKARVMHRVLTQPDHPISQQFRKWGIVPGDTPVAMVSESLRDVTDILHVASGLGIEARGILLDQPDAWFTLYEKGRDAIPANVTRISFMNGKPSNEVLLQAVEVAMPDGTPAN